MNATVLFNFLMIAGAIQGFVFNIATLLSRKKIEKPVLFLNLFVLFISLNNLQSWWVEKNLISANFFIRHFLAPWYILIVPMFYVFLIYYLELEKKRRHFLIFSGFLFLLAILARSLVLGLASKGLVSEGGISNYNMGEDIVALAYSIFLFVKSVRLLFNYRALYSQILAFDDLLWIKRFMFFGGGVFLLWMLAIFFNLTGMVKAPYSYYPLRLGSSLLIYWVGYQAFFRYIVMKDRILLRKEIRKDLPDGDADIQYNLRQARKMQKEEKTFKLINDYILEQQKYLDPYLSLEQVSEEVAIGVSSLSKIMNTHTGGNFPEYINNLRVAEAKKFLADESYSPYTIVAIGLECGFNSKSSFYAAFKKYTRQTPTQYRKSFSN
jgi:AraC-like DNA-binding protein